MQFPIARMPETGDSKQPLLISFPQQIFVLLLMKQKVYVTQHSRNSFPFPIYKIKYLNISIFSPPKKNPRLGNLSHLTQELSALSPSKRGSIVLPNCIMSSYSLTRAQGRK
jgi:hypothetical protein